MARYQEPVPQYLDGAGNPLANGQLFFFKSGTNSQLTTYKDEIESIPNTQPLLLDAAARVPNAFFSGSAKVVLIADDLSTGEVGTQIFERDPVGGEKELGDFTLWDAQVIYDVNDIVEGSNGKFYISLVNANQADNPVTPSPTKWSEIRFLGIYNVNISYAIGDVTQTTDGNLWKSLTAVNLNNDPSTDSGTNWIPAIDTANVLIATNTVIPQTVSGTLTALRINELQDAGAFTIPLANTVLVNQTITISQPDEFVSFIPVTTASGSDTITDSDGTDTSITFDNTQSLEIILTSDGVSDWRL